MCDVNGIRHFKTTKCGSINPETNKNIYKPKSNRNTTVLKMYFYFVYEHFFV